MVVPGRSKFTVKLQPGFVAALCHCHVCSDQFEGTFVSQKYVVKDLKLHEHEHDHAHNLSFQQHRTKGVHTV